MLSQRLDDIVPVADLGKNSLFFKKQELLSAFAQINGLFCSNSASCKGAIIFMQVPLPLPLSQQTHIIVQASSRK